MAENNCEEAIQRIAELQAENRELKEKIRHLELLATRDPLTGLLNRRGGDAVLEHHYAMLTRDNCEKNNFAVLSLDLDRFKGINDTHGHETGDDVLKFFGDVLARSLRGHEHDAVIRLGGDEFLVVLPECNDEHAKVVKEKIKKSLAAATFRTKEITLSLRTSIGVATARDASGEVVSLGKVLAQADKAMYEDKAINKAARKR